MDYKILEAHIEFTNGQPDRITVLVEMSPNDVRAIFATTKPAGAYTYIKVTDKISDQLLQRIAGYGMETYDIDKIFPNWKQYYDIKART